MGILSCPCPEMLVLCGGFIVLLTVAVVVSLRGNIFRKKVFSAILLVLAILPLQVMGTTAEGVGCFFVTSVLLMVMGIILLLIEEHRQGRVAKSSEKNSLERLLDFVRVFLSRFFVGEMLTSIYGLFLFILFAMTLTAWLPAGVQYAQPVFTLATIVYVIDIILLSAWVYGPLQRKRDDEHQIRYLVYGMSTPSNWGNIKDSNCDELKTDKVRINIVPLYVSLYRHFPSIEQIFLLYSNVHLEKRNETKDGLRVFFEKAAKCLKESYGRCVSFEVHWEEMFPGENTEVIPNAGCEMLIGVHFVNIGSANDVMEIYKRLKKDSKLMELLEKHRKGVLFHITGGTAVMSAAMVLHALKRDIRAEYLRQDAAGKEPSESLREIDIDLFEDLGDIVKELREYFERSYERK